MDEDDDDTTTELTDVQIYEALAAYAHEAWAALEKIAQIGDKANTQTDGGHPWLLVGNMAGIARDALKARKGMV